MALLILIPSFSFAQSWNIEWEKRLGNRKQDFYSDIIETKDGDFVVLGSTTLTGKSNEFWMVRYNAKGDTLWTKTLGTENRDIPKKIAELANGDFLLLGKSDKTGDQHLFLVKTDNRGNELWRKIFTDDFYCMGEDVAPTNDNGFVMAGAKGDDPENVHLWMAKLDAEGEMAWEKTFRQEEMGCIKTIKKLPNNEFIMAGQISTNGMNNCDMLVIRTDENGNEIWSNHIKSANSKEWPECVCCSPDSCFVLVGWQGNCLNDITSENPIFDFDLILNKIDCDGNVLWTKNFDSEGSEGGNAVTILPNGQLVVAGIKATSFLGEIGPWLLQIDPEGNKMSEKLLNMHLYQAAKVINCSDGGFIVVGPGEQDENNTRSDGWIMKFASL